MAGDAAALPLIGSGIGFELWSSASDEQQDYRVRKICVVARMAGIDLDLKTGMSEEEMEAFAPLAKGLVLKVCRPGQAAPVGGEEAVTQSNAILRTLAMAKADSSLYGRSEFESAQADQWLETCWKELEVPAQALAAASGNQAVIAEAKRHLLSFLATANATLSTSTFLVGERTTIADVGLACAARDLIEGSVAGGAASLGARDLAGLPHVLRWYRTVTHHPAFSATAVAAAPAPAASARGLAGAKGQGKQKQVPPAAAAVKAAAGAAAGAGAGAAGDEPLPVVGESGDLMSSASVVQGSRRLEVAPARFRRKRVRVRELLASGTSVVGQKAVVKGWLRTARAASKGALLFLVVDDGSCSGTVQVVVSKGAPGFDAAASCGGVGASVSVLGTVVASKGKGQDVEIKADEVEVLGCVYEPDGTVGASTYPLAKKAHSLEFLRSIAHLRPRTKMHSAAMRVRHAMAFATHKFFNDRGFLYIHTPIVTGADCEGAGEQFAVSTLLPDAGGEEGNGHAAAAGGGPPMTPAGAVDYSKDFFARRTCLTVSGQLNVETHACSLGDVYTFGPTFRAENSHTSRHLAEFWMIEPEVAFADLKDDMDLAEDYLKYLVAYALGHCQGDLEFFETCPGGEPGLRERLKNVLQNDFVRMTYTELVDLVRKDAKEGKVEFSVIPEWGDDLGSEHERYVAEKVYNAPCIVTDYPKDIKAFYMKLNPDGKTVAAMDILVPKIGEIIGGSQREEDLGKLTKRAKEMNLPEDSISWYLDLRRYGTIQHAGFGLGFERLVMFATGIENIRDVIPFPRYPGHASF
ncbi:Asparaginyl-tRNA Synthetase [Ectocarpus siliculosus]|uniref:asparagine--tRNA ligase n=1 Tax=Ectocarpus siliculosus TaxID=2880 RepID=D7FLN1_ECTSI|nr:Asparaginyl-tRNA Synthetase [Ectocarpus siliculosus]|eukprot:CBJ25847.1 Asparaginyl-tRNA Synthetase [Ectocarpus siliculosus]